MNNLEAYPIPRSALLFMTTVDEARRPRITRVKPSEIAKYLGSLKNPAFAKLAEEREWKEIAHDPEEDAPK